MDENFSQNERKKIQNKIDKVNANYVCSNFEKEKYQNYLFKTFNLRNYRKNSNKINFLIYLIFFCLAYPILSDYKISLTTTLLNDTNYYKILNTRYIGKPNKIYFDKQPTNDHSGKR